MTLRCSNWMAGSRCSLSSAGDITVRNSCSHISPLIHHPATYLIDTSQLDAAIAMMIESDLFRFHYMRMQTVLIDLIIHVRKISLSVLVDTPADNRSSSAIRSVQLAAFIWPATHRLLQMPYELAQTHAAIAGRYQACRGWILWPRRRWHGSSAYRSTLAIPSHLLLI